MDDKLGTRPRPSVRASAPRTRLNHVGRLAAPIWDTADRRHIPLWRIADDHLVAIYHFLTDGWETREAIAPHSADFHGWVRILVGEIMRRGLTDRAQPAPKLDPGRRGPE
jgi:hypothetical protein